MRGPRRWSADFGEIVYSPVDNGGSIPAHEVAAHTHGGDRIGHLRWNRHEIGDVDVHEDFQRQGIATSLFQHAKIVAAENPRIPAPKHSADRTDAGDAWARSVGGRLPRRSS
jgi:GNAT superfamily N-acetyltransferase